MIFAEFLTYTLSRVWALHSIQLPHGSSFIHINCGSFRSRSTSQLLKYFVYRTLEMYDMQNLTWIFHLGSQSFGRFALVWPL